MISLVNSTIKNEDIDALIDWLGTYPRLTKGEQTKAFEKEWSEWLGTKYSVFVNSGSSALLLMYYTLIESGRMKNKKVVIPALSWSTDLAPAIQLGLEPILCDCNMDDLSVSLEHLEEIFNKENPSALMLVSVMGLPPKMNEIQDLCTKYGVLLLEDCCEATGAEWCGQKVGTFGLMSAFSFYFGHHMSTIEGGMISTNSANLYNLLVSMRSHGWDRDWSQTMQTTAQQKYTVSSFDSMFTFYYPGFNLRSTDLQAFIGRKQLRRLDKTIVRRRENFDLYAKSLIEHAWKPTLCGAQMDHSSFNYPIIDRQRNEIAQALMDEEVEVRPLICGSLDRQPFYIDKYPPVSGLVNSSYVKDSGMFVPNNPDITEEDIKKITGIINAVMGYGAIE